MKQLTIITILLFNFFTLNSFGQEIDSLPPQHKAINDPAIENEIIQKAIKLLEEYFIYGTFTENGETFSINYSQKFIGLFNGDETFIYNDSRHPNISDEMLPVRQYVALIKSWYPSGVFINRGETTYGSPYYHGENGLPCVDIFTQKRIGGKTVLGKQQPILKVPLKMTIVFNEDLSRYKIQSMGLEFAPSLFIDEETQENNAITARPVDPEEAELDDWVEERYKAINTVDTSKSAKGLFLGLQLGLFPKSLSLNVDDLQTEFPNLMRASPQSIGLQGDLLYFFDEHVGIGISLGYRNYKSRIVLNNQQISESSFYDIDNDLVERRELNALLIKDDYRFDFLNASFHFDFKYPILDESLGLYSSIGLRYGFIAYEGKANNKINADYVNQYAFSEKYGIGIDEFYGFDPKNPAEAVFLDEYDLFDSQVNTEIQTRPVQVEKPLSAFISLGAAFIPSNTFQLRAGLQFEWGFNPIYERNDEVFIYEPFDVQQVGNGSEVVIDYNPMTAHANRIQIRSIGIELGIIARLGR